MDLPAPDTRLLLPDLPCLVAAHGSAVLLTPDGEFLRFSAQTAPDALAAALDGRPALMVHAPSVWRRLGLLHGLPALDLLELFAFVRPAEAAAPTPRGLARALDLPAPAGAEQEATLLPALATALLGRLAAGASLPMNRNAAALAAVMGRTGWGWARFVLAVLGPPAGAPGADALRVWKTLPEWEEVPPVPPPSAYPVSAAESRARLAELLGPQAEQRPGQADYADAAAAAFAPREAAGVPHLVLAEAGTGTGKTLGYIAPASLWAERNHGAVWLSTFTRHLQRQIDTELARLEPDVAARRRRVVVRKGRENYLCLLNLEDQVGTATQNSRGGAGSPAVIPLALIARWLPVSADGDLQGGDLPGWFSELFGGALVASLADRRGECIHAGCPHWKRCCIEHSIRRARGADLVIANHALVMAQAVWGGLDDSAVPTRYVFDEGHHLFDAADGAFAAVLSGAETAELRRWLLGAEGGRSRARGLARRIEDLLVGRAELVGFLHEALLAARALPAPFWATRLAEDSAANGNPTEALLRLLRIQVLARNGAEAGGSGAMECDLHPVGSGLPEAAKTLRTALNALARPLHNLAQGLNALAEAESETLDSAQRLRIEAMGRSLRRRALDPLAAWRAMLLPIIEPAPEPGARPEHVLFLRLSRFHSGDLLADRDVGLHRHWLDPSIPFVATLAQPAHGMLITSATLRDTGDADPERSWAAAEARMGAPHLLSTPLRASVASPFDYARQTRAFVITDLASGDLGQLAGAYRALFLAAGGGGLGLFTAISRLRAVHARIAPALAQAGIPLLAQHVDAMDNATLVDVFRAEEESCLLGTDAMRDGVDVPGRALRLVVFERVPWPRPDILHRARRIHLSDGDPKALDDRIARLRLRQAFGRLIRAGTDRGVFVLLDRQTPSRLLSAFPPGVQPQRLGLAAAVAQTAAFLAEHKISPP